MSVLSTALLAPTPKLISHWAVDSEIKSPGEPVQFAWLAKSLSAAELFQTRIWPKTCEELKRTHATTGIEILIKSLWDSRNFPKPIIA
jgi:hypothetical protein